MLISYSILRLFDRKKKNLTIMTFLKVLWIILKWWKCVCLHFGVLFVFTEQNYFSFLLCQVKYRFIASNADWSVLYWKKKKLNMLRFCKNTDAQFVSLISGLCGWVVIWGITPLRALHSYLFTSSHIPPIPKSPSFQTKTQDLMHEASHAGCLSGGHCH